ncbi:MAG: response regulator transcription factor [Gemmatimonadaceae bacterium]
MTQPLRVLLVERSETDAELIKHELQNSGMNAVTERVDSETTFRKAVRDFAPQVVLSEYMHEDFDAHAALAILRALSPTTPLIIVTGWLHGGKTVACIRGGAEDVVLKTNLHRLVASITEAFSVRQPLERLTTRQIEVLRLVAEGNRTRDIAKQLQLSVKTVESHRGEIMKRLGFHDVVNLVRYALRVGLVDVRP